jgi:hypothetical protein
MGNDNIGDLIWGDVVAVELALYVYNSNDLSLRNPSLGYSDSYKMIPQSTSSSAPRNFYSGDETVIINPGPIYSTYTNVISAKTCLFQPSMPGDSTEGYNAKGNCHFKYNSRDDSTWTGLHLNQGDELRFQVLYHQFGKTARVVEGVAWFGTFQWNDNQPSTKPLKKY